MEQFARRPLTRRHYFPQHTAFLLREGTAKFGHGKSPSPQTTLRSEKENRPGSTCQSKIAKLLGTHLAYRKSECWKLSAYSCARRRSIPTHPEKTGSLAQTEWTIPSQIKSLEY